MARRALIKAATLLLAAVLLIWLLGTLPFLRGWRDGFGFAGSILLLVPTVAAELVKHQTSRIEARLVSISDDATRRILSRELSLVGHHLQRFHSWHVWIYAAGALMLALSFRLGL